MAGLDKIIEQINADSDAAVKAILDKANADAAVIRSDAEKEAAVSGERMKRESNVRILDSKSRAESAAALTKRRMLLAQKQEIIKEVLGKAYEKICQLPENDYFTMMEKLFQKNVLPENGTVIFNLRDLNRLPTDFADRLGSIASKCGGKVVISDSTRQIDGGFILVYGGIEQNCSVNALFETNKDELQDQIQSILFNS